MVTVGRKRIYTNETRITASNVRKVVEDAMLVHSQNAQEIKKLLDIAKGDMDLVRKKEIRPEIDIKAIDPIASQIVDFKIGFEHGTPISYIQRANIDSTNPDGKLDVTAKDDMRIATLNEMMREINKASKDIQLASMIKKCGLGYRYIFPNKKRGRISPFDITIPTPLRTFVIYANDILQTKLAGVTYTEDTNGNKYYGVWTEEFLFKFPGSSTSSVTVEPNVLGYIPIVEYANNDELVGSFEKELPLIDALNVVTSDRVNDICQTVQSILWLHNTKLDDKQKGELVDGGVIQTQQTQDGKDAKIQYVNAPLNQSEIQTLASNLKERILESAGVPKLSESGQNSTGEAQRVVNGWHIAENQAKMSELNWRSAEDETLEICLAYIKNKNVDVNGIGTLKLSDIDYKMYRSENYDITSRVNAFITLVTNGFDLTKSAVYCKITDDPQQFCLDSQENVDKLRFSNNTEREIVDKTVESIQPDTVKF